MFRNQNTLARVVKEHGKYDRITSLLSQLHWLPTDVRIRHKIDDKRAVKRLVFDKGTAHLEYIERGELSD